MPTAHAKSAQGPRRRVQQLAGLRSVLGCAIAVVMAGGLAGCGGAPKTPSPLSGTTDAVDFDALPTISEAKAQMLALIDEVQVAVSAVVPATRPWRWKDHWGSGTCLGDKPFGDDGVSLNFPNLVSGYSLSEAQWDLVFPRVRDIAVAAGLTEGWSPNDAAGSHDVRFHSPDGRTLIFGTRVATLISARLECFPQRGQRLERGPDGRIPMPPDPTP